MSNTFAARHRRPIDPAITIFDISPDDGADLPWVTLALNLATLERLASDRIRDSLLS